MTNKQEIDELRAELAKLKASVAPEPVDDAAMGRWKDEMHQMAERRAAAHNPFSRADIEAMRAACPDSVVRGIVRDNRAPTGRPGVIPSQHDVRPGGGAPPANTSGWRESTPLSNPPGIGFVDMLCEVDAAKQRGERMLEEAKRKAAGKSHEPQVDDSRGDARPTE